MLPQIMEDVTALSEFMKVAPKLNTMSGPARLAAVSQLRCFKEGKMPAYIGKMVVQKLMEEACLDRRLELLDKDTSSGIGILPELERESFLLGHMNKVASNSM